jgi:two-component system chemotaxis sensor kinase CheA
MTPDELPIQSVDGMPVVILRNGSMAPLYHLDVMLGLSADAGRMPATTDRIVLVELGRRVRALAVEGIVGGREIVVKPLGGMLNHIGNLGGATVLGDGKIVLILDPRSLFTMGE